MGELIKQTGHLGQWLDKIDATRNDLIASAKSGNRVAAAFAMADARVELIESLKDQAIRAKLLRMTDPEIAMVELANNPNDEDRIRICAIGILSGFTPGDEQFAIFGGGFDKRANKPKPGKLYIKERGFRTLFGHLGIVPEVRTGHPTWGAYGGGDKKLWSVTGSAECSYNGENYAVEFTGESSVRIDGYDSDNTAGIAAKCRRRLLQALWTKVSPILTQDQAYDSEDELDTLPVETTTARIDAKPIQTEDTDTRYVETATPNPATSFADKWRGLLTGIKSPANAIAADLFAAWKVSDIKSVSSIYIEKVVPVKMREEDRDKLKAFVDAIGEYIKSEANQ